MESEATYTFYVDMPREKTWEKLRDFTLAPNYVPGVKSVRITTDKKEGVGTSRYLLPNKMNETIIEWDDGNGFILKLHKDNGSAPAPFKEAGFVYAIEDDGEKTKFNIALTYTMGMGAFGRILNDLLLGKIISSTIRNVGISLKHFYETGEPVTPQILKRLKANA